MGRLWADSGKMTLNICKLRIFLFKFKRVYAVDTLSEQVPNMVHKCAMLYAGAVVALDSIPNKL